MNLLETVSYYLNLIMAISVVIFGLIAGLLFYLLKVKKISAKTEIINYDSFSRKDASEYAKFENIVSEDPDSLKSAGMIAMGKNRFVGGISVTGYNYATASIGERERTMINAISFFNVVEHPIQMRQNVTAIDLSYNIDIFKEELVRFSKEGLDLQEEYKDTLRESEDYIDSEEKYPIYAKKLDELQRALETKKHEIAEAQAVIRYMETMSNGKNSDPQKNNQIMFSYVFNPDDYTDELSDEEIYARALRELDTRGRGYAEALGRCGCSCKRLSAAELVLLMKKFCSPLSEDVRIEDLLNSSYDALFITSDSLMEFEKERLGEEEFNRMMEEYHQRQKEELHRHETESMRLQQKVLNEAEAQAKLRMVAG